MVRIPEEEVERSSLEHLAAVGRELDSIRAEERQRIAQVAAAGRIAPAVAGRMLAVGRTAPLAVGCMLAAACIAPFAAAVAVEAAERIALPEAVAVAVQRLPAELEQLEPDTAAGPTAVVRSSVQDATFRPPRHGQQGRG